MTKEIALANLRLVRESLSVAYDTLLDIQSQYVGPLIEKGSDVHNHLALSFSDEGIDALKENLSEVMLLLETLPIELIEG